MQSAAEETGWAVYDMGFPGDAEPDLIAASVDGSGRTVVFVSDSAGNMYFITDEPWSQWTAVGGQSGATVDRIRVGTGSDGSLRAFVLTMTSGSQSGVYEIVWDSDKPAWSLFDSETPPSVIGDYYDFRYGS